MGGVGKTALAVALAHRLIAHYPDAQLVFNLHGVDPEPTKPAKVMERVIQSFYPTARMPDDPDQLAGVYRSVLAQAGKVLLLLDNVANAEQIELLLPPPNCLLLVTSRAHFHLPGLACRSLDCLASEKSCELLLNLAPRLRDRAAEAAELCGRLPLALEVFASLVHERTTYSVPQLIERLRRRSERLTKVEAAFALSYDLLSAELQQMWTQISVFPASFDAQAAAAVFLNECNETAFESARLCLQQLVNTSLVEWHESAGRFRLHDLARQFAQEKLTTGEATTARLRHAAYFCKVGEWADDLYLRGQENIPRGLALFDKEWLHIEAAFGWLSRRTGQESDVLLVRIVQSITYASDLRFHPRERIRWREAQRAAARRIEDRQGEAYALSALGSAHAALSEARMAIEYYDQALQIARELGDRPGEGNALGNLGTAYADLGEPRKAIEFYEQRLKIAQELGNRRGEGNALGNLERFK